MEAILKEYHAQLVAENKDTTSGVDPERSTTGNTSGPNRIRKRMKTREKIEKLVSDGARNYPAYLKLVHTGDSDFSDDETIERQIRNKNLDREVGDTVGLVRDKEEIIDLGDPGPVVLGTASPGDEKKDATKEQRLEVDKKDGLYEEIASPEYENAVNTISDPVDLAERTRMEEEWKSDLAKLEDEIQTLRQVLSCKVREAGELKKKLGITPMGEFKHDLRQGLQNIKDSDAYQKTASSLSTAGEKVSASPAYQKTNLALKAVGNKTAGAFATAGSFASKKLGDMRNSTAFKSFEEKLGGAYSNVKHSRSIGNLRSKMVRVRGSKSENNFEDALRSSSHTEEQNGGSASYPASPMSADEKVPL